jgi:hypothetical protein
MAIQIGKYKRPGIFIEEFDQSVITSPTVAGGISTMVIGFSKKGPVNTPVQLTNTNDLETIFGSLDRGLERKGSFFHRTIAKMLESSPVYALNLLSTDDTLDKIQYRSLSAASDKANGDLLTDSYRKFFNTTGFWKRDTDSFIDLTKNDSDYNNVIVNFTNLSDRPISIFVFKTKMSGFDRSLIEWYGTAEKVPSYLNVNDYASEYMVDVVVVGGDWTNYNVLAVDPRWSRYFDSTGLKKNMVSEFANDRNVNLLAYYEGLSLIPYFRDANGRNIFIESVVNRDTDRTGLFCAFNIDLFETDYPMGMVDLIGNNLVGTEISQIDFLSYNDIINEVAPFSDVVLDRTGNGVAIIGTWSSFRTGVPATSADRTAFYTEGYVNGVTCSLGSATFSSINVSLTFGSDPYTIIGGSKVTISNATSSFTIGTSSFGTLGATYTSTIVARSTGIVELVTGTVPDTNPSVGITDTVFGYVKHFINGGGQFGTPVYNPVYVKNTGYNEMSWGTSSTSDYYVNTSGTSVVVTFQNTAATPNVRSYEQYRRFRMFNYMVNWLDGGSKAQMTTIFNGTTREKKSLTDVVVSNIVTSTTSNKSFTLSGLSTSNMKDGLIIFYLKDDEFKIVGSTGETSGDANTIITTETVANTSTGQGVAAKYSKFYLDYLNGTINSGDYFYTNFVESDDEFTVEFTTLSGTSYIVLDTNTGSAANGWPESTGVSSGDTLRFPDSSLNTGSIVINDTVNDAALFGGTGNGSDGIYAYAVEGSLLEETLTDVTKVYNINAKHYLKIFIDSSDNLQVEFTDNAGDAQSLSDDYNLLNEILQAKSGFDVFSNKLNYKQTIEIVYPTGYSQSPNKVLCNASRYSEVKVGDFLEAYVDTPSLRPGEVPRRLTRILSKKFYPADTTLVEISCDARIAVTNYGTVLNPDWQTTRYTTIEDYVSTYKSITLAGFKMRAASMPDGTEARQNQILNLVANGTPMFNALVNKEALDFRYLIDSFGLGLIEKSKQQLVDICGARLDCFGFINMPSMKQFKASTDPSFTNADGVLDTSFIANGGDPESNPSFYYSFGDGAGSTCVSYLTPYLTIGDNGRPLDVPPAMFVATTYLRKHNSNITSIVPWTIAAGVSNGRVTGFDNVEMDFTPLDIENLNQAQMNPIVFKRNRGFVIETENTAQTLYRSSLSYIHVREVLIELERELSRMLLDFQWKFNTAEIRAEIKLRADVICEQYVSKNGLFNYFNKCDDENNTPDVIDNQIGVLDTYVEPIKGMGIIVNNITILRTGAIQSGGFITA